MENQRGCQQNRHARQCDQGQPDMEREHEEQRQRKHHDNAEHRDKLFGKEVLDHVDVGCTALNDVSRAVFAVPIVGKRQQVAEHLIPHGFDQRFGGFGIEHARAVEEREAEHGNADDDNADHPELFPQNLRPAETVEQVGKERRQIERFASEDRIHRHADDLRREHIGQRQPDGGQNRGKKPPLRAVQKGRHQPQPTVISFQKITS